MASLPARSRDAEIERSLHISEPPPTSLPPPGEHLLGCHSSGLVPIVRALLEVPVGPDDVLVDLGCGMGKVVLLSHLLTGVRAKGIELQPGLVERARHAASSLGADVTFLEGDARHADLSDGTIFYLYAPFTGPVLTEVVGRLHQIAQRRAIVVCALGIDLPRAAPWLVARSIDAFWLTIYDSVIAGVPPRALRSSPLGPLARALAHE